MRRQSEYFMKFKSLFATVLLLGAFTLGAAIDVQAKRLGGGQSFGRQSNSFGSPAMPKPAAPIPNAAPRPGAPSANPATAPQRRFGGMGGILGGLAAGLGIGWLLSHFGLGEAASTFFMGLIAIFAIMMIGSWLLRRFANNSSQSLNPADGPHWNQTPYQSSQATQESTPTPNSTAGCSSTNISANGWVDQESFLNNAKKHFIELQEASDKQDIAKLKEFTTPEMFEFIRNDLLNRANPFAQTQVLTLHAELVAVESNSIEHLASVKFSGLIREEANAPSETFTEIWNWTKPLNEQTGWVLAGIEQLS